MIIQLLSALQAIHSYGLACRSLDCKHVLETARNRFRVGSVGVMDVLEPRSNVGELQSQDLRQLGCVLVLLGSRGCAATELASLAQEAPNDPHYKQIPQRYHSMKYPR